MAEDAHPSAGRVSPALSSVSDTLPTVHTPLMVGQEYDPHHGPSPQSSSSSSSPQLQHSHPHQSSNHPHYYCQVHQPRTASQASICEEQLQSEVATSSTLSPPPPSSSSTFQPHQLAQTDLIQQCLNLQRAQVAQGLPPEVMDLPMTVCPSLENGDTPTFSLSGDQSLSSSHFLESGSLPTISTPLMDSKSDPYSFMDPSTALANNNGDKSETTSIYSPICRICHMSGEDGGEGLISPCRCSGTLQFIHNTCLQRWLEIMSKKSRKPPKCELCHFQYHRHKKFKFHHWRFPRVSSQDKILHIIFIVNLIMMIGCAVATVMSFLSDKGTIHTNPPGNNVELSTEEIVTLSCGVLFFVSFFIAMSVQIKAKHTIYQLFVKFIMQNMEWEIDEYDKSKDTLYKDLYKGLPVYV